MKKNFHSLHRLLYLLPLFVLLFTVDSSSQFLGGYIQFKENEIAPSVYFQGSLDTSHLYYLTQVNFMPFTIIHDDTYNDKTDNVSVLPWIRSIPIALGLYLVGGHDFGKGALPDSSAFRKIYNALIYPLFFINSQHYLVLGPTDLRYSMSPRPSLFAGIQTDYFTGEQVNWLRLSPSFGFELGQSLFGKNNETPRLSLALQVGVARRFDFSRHFNPRANTTLFFGFKFGGVL